MLHPLKFRPVFKDKLWGGQKIKTILKKDFSPLPNCGESWEISGVRDNVSIVSGGEFDGLSLVEMIRKYKGKLLGNRVYTKYGETFPLLVKFLDANDDLSIQVHPDDKLARVRHNSYGKTEMWYIIQADTDARLITGFNRELNKKRYLDYFKQGRLMEVLNQEPVRDDDVFFIPAGRVHTIGKGLLVAEIQQTSDLTYRIYDFDRKDNNGHSRELHVEDALDAMDYKYYPEYRTRYTDKKNQAVQLVSCQYFTTNKIWADERMERNYERLDSFKIIICLKGKLTIEHDNGSVPLSLGKVVLIPATITNISLHPETEYTVLESYVSPESHESD